MSHAIGTGFRLGAGRIAELPVRIGSALVGTLAGWEHEWRLRRDLRVVQEMTSRQLADIGIGRGQEEDAVRRGRSRNAAFTACRAISAPLMPASWTEWR